MIPFVIVLTLFASFLVWFFVGEHRRRVRLAARRKAREVEDQEREARFNAEQDQQLKNARVEIAKAASELRVAKRVTKYFDDEEADLRRQIEELDA